MPSAIAIVRMIVGAVDIGGLTGIPSHPATPIAEPAENATVRSKASTPQIERRNRNIARSKVPYMAGRSVLMSWSGACWSA